MTTSIAIIAGVGPGTGASVARRFARSYPVILLSRKPESYQALEQEIKTGGGKALGISTDLAKPESLRSAFEQIEKAFPEAACAAAVFNATGPFVRKSVLELTEEDMDAGYAVGMRGSLLFSQHTIPLLLKHAEQNPSGHPPTLVFTGATASIKGSALFAAFSAPKFGMRSIAQSIAREFAPKGVHVAHAIIDGAIDVPSPAFQKFLAQKPENEKTDPEAIAETYWTLHTQSRRCFTFEVDIRPCGEKW